MLRCALAVIVTIAATCAAQNRLAEYPLRVHVFRRSQTTFYNMRVAEAAKGEGRANLFQNGAPRGMDFQFDCANGLQTSSGFETFPAKWKKPDRELEVLMPEFGKPDKYEKCKFEVQMKDFAYVQHNGMLGTEPIDLFKQWMVKHDYDPEHGKNTPVMNQPTGQAQQPTTQSQ